ncbi:MAG: IS66 family insertion sequence element accessory protein TnpA [Oligoflexus sp.]
MDQAHRSSGLTAAEFSKKHNLSIHTLKNQIYKQKQQTKSQNSQTSFVEILPPLATTSRPRFITLSTSSGLMVQIPEGIDPRWLSSVLPAIGG